MRAGLLDAEDRRILSEGLRLLSRFRAGWAASAAGPFHHSARIDALVRAGLMEKSRDGAGAPIAWTNIEGQRALAALREIAA